MSRPDVTSSTALPEEDSLLHRVCELCPDIDIAVERVTPRRIWLRLDPREVRKFFRALKERWPVLHLSTITGLDTGSEIEVIYHVVVEKIVLNVRTVLQAENPEIETIMDLLPVADTYERELHDVLGIRFTGRASTPRLVLPDGWPEGYYPLRKSRKGGEDDVGHGDPGGTPTSGA